MSKIIMEFNLPEERNEFGLANNGGSAHFVLEELANQLRTVCKHSDDAEAVKYADHWRTVLFDLISSYNVKIWEEY